MAILQKSGYFAKKWLFCKKWIFARKLYIPVFSSFFDSSKFFLNLFAACLIFTEVLELVFYYFSYSLVQLRFEPTLQFDTWRRRVLFVRLSDVGYVRQISRIHLGHVTSPNSSPTRFKNVLSSWLTLLTCKNAF